MNQPTNQPTIDFYIKTVDEALLSAHNYQSNLSEEVLRVPGMSGIKTKHFLNNLIPKIHGRYLEIGVYVGSTFCSSLYKSKTNNYSIAIDNWSEFSGPKKAFMHNFKKYINLDVLKVGFLEKDCFNITSNDLKIEKYGKFKTYLYDGPHKFDDHYKALINYISFLEDDFIFLCDDWNWTEHVEFGTRKAIKDLGIVVHKEWVMKTYKNIDDEKLGWWNGYYAMVGSKQPKI
jgi:hypothetical protein